MAASILMRCTTPPKAVALFEAAYADQAALFGGAQKLDQTAIGRIMAAPLNKRAALLAREAGIERWFAGRGLSPVQGGKCLADPAAQQRLVDLREAAVKTYNINGTPAFVVNGKVVDGGNWDALESASKAAL